jgi:hypothetical protein
MACLELEEALEMPFQMLLRARRMFFEGEFGFVP